MSVYDYRKNEILHQETRDAISRLTNYSIHQLRTEPIVSQIVTVINTGEGNVTNLCPVHNKRPLGFCFTCMRNICFTSGLHFDHNYVLYYELPLNTDLTYINEWDDYMLELLMEIKHKLYDNEYVNELLQFYKDVYKYLNDVMSRNGVSETCKKYILECMELFDEPFERLITKDRYRLDDEIFDCKIAKLKESMPVEAIDFYEDKSRPLVIGDDVWKCYQNCNRIMGYRGKLMFVKVLNEFDYILHFKYRNRKMLYITVTNKIDVEMTSELRLYESKDNYYKFDLNNDKINIHMNLNIAGRDMIYYICDDKFMILNLTNDETIVKYEFYCYDILMSIIDVRIDKSDIYGTYCPPGIVKLITLYNTNVEAIGISNREAVGNVWVLIKEVVMDGNDKIYKLIWKRTTILNTNNELVGYIGSNVYSDDLVRGGIFICKKGIVEACNDRVIGSTESFAFSIGKYSICTVNNELRTKIIKLMY